MSKDTSPELLPYEYHALSDEVDQIRLLRLLPGRRGAKLYVDIDIVGFSDTKHLHRYEALSYAWGSHVHDAGIFVLHGHEIRALAITRNLEEALDHLRSELEIRILWVDAVCINQGDALEKSHQVSRMTEIFANAAKVVAWIGPETEDSGIAIDVLNEINSHVKADIPTATLKPVSETSHWSDPYEYLSTEDFKILALNHLLERDRFQRLWIWPEIHSATEGVLMCGARSLFWSKFLNAFAVLSIKPMPETVLASQLFDRITSMARLCLGRSFSTFTALQAGRNCLCSDQRDKVYATAGLIDPMRRNVMIQPDYRVTVQQAYTRIALDSAEVLGDLDFLSFGAEKTLTPGLPSWAPDWATNSEVTQEMWLLASAGTKHLPGFLDSKRLAVKGSVVCSVDHILPYPFKTKQALFDTGWQREIEYFVQQVFYAGLPGQNRTEEDLGRLCRVLFADNFEDAQMSRSFDNPNLTFAGCKSFLKDIAVAGTSEAESRDFVYERLHEACEGRSFFVSEAGRNGLVKHRAQKNDIIVILFGCNFALALRPAGDCYEVVGDACCDGTMYGEMLLGPLPEDIVLHYNFSNAQFPFDSLYFRDRRTGVVASEDPRLPPLPDCWERLEQGFQSTSRFRHKETGEIRDCFSDPRLDIESLQERGVWLQDFVLV